MAKKRYRLTDSCESFDNDGLFGLQLRFGEKLDDGRTRVCSYRRCPVIRMPKLGVLQIENPIAQFFLERMITPTKTERNGKRHKAGPMFKEVTKSTKDYDVDFESLMEVRP